MHTIKFNPRWKEELVASSNEGVLVFELTMGKYHVYFPDQKRWETAAPDWAKSKWKIYLKNAQHGVKTTEFQFPS